MYYVIRIEWKRSVNVTRIVGCSGVTGVGTWGDGVPQFFKGKDASCSSRLRILVSLMFIKVNEIFEFNSQI